MSPARHRYRPFAEASDGARGFKPGGRTDQWRFVNSRPMPAEIPALPHGVNEKEVLECANWLAKPPATVIPRSFTQAREFVKTLGLRTLADWLNFCESGRKPDDIPDYPYEVYRDDWLGWSHWFGSDEPTTPPPGQAPHDNIPYVNRPFPEAKRFARELGLKSEREWRVYCRSGSKPEDIPTWPFITYRYTGWAGWADFLGPQYVRLPPDVKRDVRRRDKSFRPFVEAREIARALSLKNQRQWRELCRSGKRPPGIPADPARIYPDWQGWPDFLGTASRTVRKG